MLVTSVIDPEKIERVQFQRWGGIKKHLIKPFQVWTSVDNKVQTFYEGISKRRLKKFIEKPAVFENSFFFFPNEIETYLKAYGQYYIRMPIDHYNAKATGDNELRLANITFCFVDFDPKGATEEEKESSRNSFLEKLYGFGLPPDVVVDSGNGFHAYWAVEAIHVLRWYDEEPHPAIKRFRSIQKALGDYFDGDPVCKTGNPRLMRIPGTWNVKGGVKKRCKEIKGDLIAARISPKYTLAQIHGFLKSEGLIKRNKATKKKRGKRPKPRFDGWNEALNAVKDHFGIKRVSQQFKKTFKFYFGHLSLQQEYVIEGVKNRKHLGTNGKQIKKAREQLIAMGLVRIVTPADYKKKLAAVIEFTELFFRLCGVTPRRSRISEEKRNRVIQEVLNAECPSGRRRELLPLMLRRLVNEAGLRDPDQIEDLLCRWIDNRPSGLPRDYDGIDHLISKNTVLNRKSQRY
jgi:hypothetical protein